MSFEQVKYDVAVANRILSEVGLATGILASSGHASMRVPDTPDRFVVKGRGYAIDVLSLMTPDEMVVCDLDGNFIEGPDGSTQCMEVKMHSCIYKTHPEVNSVVHVHPRHIVLMTVLGATLKPMCQEGIRMVAKPLPVYPHVRTVHSDAEGMDVATQLGDHKAILLQGHGATTTGRSLQESVMNMLGLEEQARLNWQAYCAAGPDYPGIAPELVAEMEGREAVEDMPHFRERMNGHPPRLGGNWGYFVTVVSKDL